MKTSVDFQVKSSMDTEDVGTDLKKVNFGGWKMEVDNTNIKPPTPEPPPQEKSKKFYLKKARVKNFRKIAFHSENGFFGSYLTFNFRYKV